MEHLSNPPKLKEILRETLEQQDKTKRENEKREPSLVLFRVLTRRSVLIQLICSLSRTYKNIGAQSDCTWLLLFDLSKAFDAIKHSFFMKKHLQLNLNENFYRIIHDSLTGRTYSVRIERLETKK